MSTEKIFFCIHGHFYQPPRENPLTNEIDIEYGAAPFHDWNEKIFSECYLPNSEAGIYNDDNIKIKEVNNYCYLNFNFGPTLISWIRKNHPETYYKIIEADKKSLEYHHGHGNAIAQVYNHIIMPLANDNDKITQIKWGIADFKFHFGRQPEGMWLAETACNQNTIEALISCGIKYIILDQSQADSICDLDNENWFDVSNGQINPKFGYKCFSELDKNRSINIIFYDGALSKAAAFEDITKTGEQFLKRVKESINEHYPAGQLVCLATDGETFGHHKKFSDRTLAYFLTELAAKNNLYICNLGEYLELFPPKMAVKIKAGENNEGTSWSCRHGVKRWRNNCGDSTGGEEGWTQQWRKPLRDAVNNLRDSLKKEFTEKGAVYFQDAWEARNEYINLILDQSENVKLNFVRKNLKKDISEDEMNIVIKMLEIQKYSLLMFTSCAWFFSEISGIETVQILKYANLAMELHRQITGENLKTEFVNTLSKAKSNIKKYKNGGDVFAKLV
ncbi:hypothetical protein BH10BAC5_BH10BAC5_10480 [soil metagenome]